MREYLKLIGNADTLNLDETKWYAAILGAEPSKGARSPVLWNAAFDQLGQSAKMHPMDVADEDLVEVVAGLKEDELFIGGAVAVPHKETIGQYLDGLEEEARIIGAVNCIYRRDGKLIGTNTDGAGALASLEKQTGSIEGKTVLQLGLGGAGKAVGVYLARALREKGTLLVANRTHVEAEKFVERIKPFCQGQVVAWPVGNNEIGKADILVNCTSVGYFGNGQDFFTPLASLPELPDVSNKISYAREIKNVVMENYSESYDKLLHLKPDTFVFDIIYQPERTLLLLMAERLGLPTLNGKQMNMDQAVIAFDKAVQSISQQSIFQEEIRNYMQSI